MNCVVTAFLLLFPLLVQAVVDILFPDHVLLKLTYTVGIHVTAKVALEMCAVCRFFAGYRVRPDGIHFVMHADGRPSGMAFVEFDCPQEAMRALVCLVA